MPKPDRLSPRDGSDYVASVSSLVQHYCTCENCLGMPSATIAGRNALEELKYIVAEIERDIAHVDITLVTSLLGVYDAAHRIARGRKLLWSLSTDTVNACIRHGLRVTSA